MRIISMLLPLCFLSVPAFAQTENAGTLKAWTTAPVSRTHPQTALQTRMGVTKAAGYDRAVFTFADRVPGYKVEFAQPPFGYGESDNVVPVAGKKFLRVKLAPCNAHNESGTAKVSYLAGKLTYPLIQQSALIYDFEANVEWVLGLRKHSGFRVIELQNPPRLVVDVRH